MCGRTCSRPSPSLRAGRPDPSRPAGGRRAAGRWRGRGQWVDRAPPLARGAAVRGARQAGGRPVPGPRRAARGRAGADCRAGGRQPRINPDLVATTLELTPAETQVAVWLAEGKRGRDMAKATGHTDAAIYWHLQRIYQKHSLSRQADLVRLVLSLAELG